MTVAELELQSALVATVAGNHGGIFVEEVSVALMERFNLNRCAFSVHRHFPDDFLICFRTREDRSRVAAGSLHAPHFQLVFTPWSHLAGGEPVTARFCVRISIHGILDHAWSCSAAEFILTPFYLIDNLALETSSGQDMSEFRLLAWTANPDWISRSSELLLPVCGGIDHHADPDHVFRFGRSLIRFPVSIHVEETEDYRLPSPPPPPDAGLGDPDAPGRGPPPVPGPWPRRHEHPPSAC